MGWVTNYQIFLQCVIICNFKNKNIFSFLLSQKESFLRKHIISIWKLQNIKFVHSLSDYEDFKEKVG